MLCLGLGIISLVAGRYHLPASLLDAHKIKYLLSVICTLSHDMVPDAAHRFLGNLTVSQ